MEGPSGAPPRKPKPHSDHILRKRQSQKPQFGKTVIYVNTKTPVKALLDRCSKLISEGEKEITIYCLGAAIQRGTLLALKVCEENVGFQIHTNTFTTELIDDLEPATDDADYAIQRRFNSALKIKVSKPDLL
ncbi:ribonuclease P protein subunit p20 isoform X2 [Tribolium castaneum]|uniref:Ribonuclease P protein subunit p20 n=1 Tax=Tribolium castaneum TaxID=7070 RepID=D6WVU2_TRICA|nr:PREDICTED: ribonuclease P protein subunit p20 [Tribolium castaneum]EFA08615.2 Ribonuclease P protein subunit p20-like Protein [Tribolium castaneum]|eukprot:XP_969995.1 PREDICTED: ribonuclease P protein subunit p20 [Tribolium castaneum]